MCGAYYCCVWSVPVRGGVGACSPSKFFLGLLRSFLMFRGNRARATAHWKPSNSACLALKIDVMLEYNLKLLVVCFFASASKHTPKSAHSTRLSSKVSKDLHIATVLDACELK